MNYITCSAGNRYRVISKPENWDEDKFYPATGLVGICKFTSTWNGACLDFNGQECVIPYDCLEEAKSENIEDALLVSIILENPEAVIKLLRGLWRMTKHITIRDLMERGILPDIVEETPKAPTEPLKPREECNRNWDDWENYCRESGMIVSGC